MMMNYKTFGKGQIILLIFSTLIFINSFVEGFNVGIRATTCSLDPSESNNACKSLYDAECDGAHCKCPSGTHEDKALKKCVPGAASKSKGDDEFGDLPFDYVPGKKPEPKPKPKPAQPLPPVQPKVPAQPQAPVEGGYKPNPYNPNAGYPGQPGGYPSQPGYNPNYPGQPGYNPNQPGRYPPQPGYPNQPGYNPNQPGYKPNQPDYNPNQPVYNPNQPGKYPPQPGYNPNQPGYNPNQPHYVPQPGYPGYDPNRPGGYNPNQPGYNPNQPGSYNPGSSGGRKGTYTGDPHMAEKTGGGIGGGVGLLIIIAIVYCCCCRGEKGKNMRSKLPFFKGGGSQPGANYQMQQQQPEIYPNAPPPAGG
ncbi:hypothetical protein Anas_01908 [Armadillidium nasatum]|uniref:Uncharacterized protein n=1 Tax=Armadillidium nasatum TaxID=96803 RepID=A0A5N5T1Z7_9CRUS|nr:hypothetical protein Anas_01908 [Armadillidium nasatum]